MQPGEGSYSEVHLAINTVTQFGTNPISPHFDKGGVPYKIGWAHEKASKPSESKFFHEMEHIGQLPAWLGNLNAKP